MGAAGEPQVGGCHGPHDPQPGPRGRGDQSHVQPWYRPVPQEL